MLENRIYIEKQLSINQPDNQLLEIHPEAVTRRAVIPNWGAAKGCQGCRRILKLYLFIIIVQHRVPQMVIFSWLWMSPNIFLSFRVPRTKKVEKPCRRDSLTGNATLKMRTNLEIKKNSTELISIP